MSFSIKSIRNTSALMPLRHPGTNEALIEPNSNTAVCIEVVGIESREFNERVLKATEGKKAPKTAEETKEFYYDGLLATVVGWNDAAAECFKEEFEGDGSYTPEKARKLFSDPGYFWICKQIDKFLADRTRFFS